MKGIHFIFIKKRKKSNSTLSEVNNYKQIINFIKYVLSRLTYPIYSRSNLRIFKVWKDNSNVCAKASFVFEKKCSPSQRI